MAARERTFAASLAHIERLVGGPGTLLDIGTAAGRFPRRGDAARLEGRRLRAEPLACRVGLAALRRPHPSGQRLRAAVRAGQLRRRDALGRHRAHDESARVIEQCRALLKPGGLLIVNYPDIGSWIARALGRRWLFLTSVHLHYFDRRTITRLLESAGFEVGSRAPARPAAGAGLHPDARLGAQRRAPSGARARRVRHWGLRESRCRTGSARRSWPRDACRRSFWRWVSGSPNSSGGLWYL